MAIPATHKAWLYSKLGAAREVLHLKEISVPEMGPKQVLVKLEAAALNPLDNKRRIGYLEKNSPLPIVPGYDGAGAVVNVGAETSKFKQGDEVYAMASEAVIFPNQYGTLAQYAAIDETYVAAKPKNLSFLEAASLPLAILTATQGLRRAGCGEGKSVLVLGGSGGVGTHAIQVAKHVFKAAHVAATGSASKTEFLKSLGADKVIDYKSENYVEMPGRYDIIFDTVGEGPTKGVQVLKEGGTLLSIMTQDPAYRHVVKPSGEDLEMLNAYLASGELKAIVDSKGKFQFSQVVEACEYLESGRATGKVVVGPIP